MSDEGPRQRIGSLSELIDRLGSGETGLTQILDSLGEAVTIRDLGHGSSPTPTGCAREHML